MSAEDSMNNYMDIIRLAKHVRELEKRIVELERQVNEMMQP